MSALKKIDAQSENAFHSALNIFTVPPTNVSIHKSQIRELLPLNSVDTSPYEFRVFSDNQWMDLSKTYLYLELELQKQKEGEDEWTKLDAADTDVGFKQAVGQSFISQLTMSINSTDVYDSTKLYPYLSYIKNELFYPPSMKDSWLTASGYYRDTRKDNRDSAGFKKRVEMAREGRHAEVMARLDFDLANQNLYLLNNLDVVFKIFKNQDRYLIHHLPATNQVDAVQYQYRVKVHNVRLYFKAIDVQPSLNLSVHDTLEKMTAKYPIRRTEIRSTQLVTGRTDYTYNVFTNVVPRRMVVAMTDNVAYNGDIHRDPFNFRPFDVQEITIHANGQTYPANPYRMRWDEDVDSTNYLRAYVDMQDATRNTINLTNGITQDQYRNGWTFFVFTLTSTLEDCDGFELIQNSTTTVQLKFNKPIDSDVQLICIGEFDQILSIDHNRIAVSDGAV